MCIHVCVCSNAPTTHININNFISSHVLNEQLEFWWFPVWGALKRNQQSSVLIMLLLPLHKKVQVTKPKLTLPRRSLTRRRPSHDWDFPTVSKSWCHKKFSTDHNGSNANCPVSSSNPYATSQSNVKFSSLCKSGVDLKVEQTSSPPAVGRSDVPS